MPNWCYNNIRVEAGNEETKTAIKRLIVKQDENGEDKVDFGIISPVPEALSGILALNSEGVSFPKINENRLTSLPVSKFFEAVRNKGALDTSDESILFGMVESLGLPAKRSKSETGKIEFTDEQLQHLSSVEGDVQRLIDETDDFNTDTPAEQVLEVLLNKALHKAYQPPYTGKDLYDVKVKINIFRDRIFGEPLSFLISLLESEHEDCCLKLYGSKTLRQWQIANWGTKWNAGDTFNDSDEWDWSFDTAWSPPASWFGSLASKINELGLEDYTVTMQSVEGGNWFGCVMTIEDGAVTESDMDDDSIRNALGMEDEDEEDEDEM